MSGGGCSPFSVFLSHEVEREVATLEEVDWKGLICVFVCVCVSYNECLLYIPSCSCHHAWGGVMSAAESLCGQCRWITPRQ